MSKVKFTRASKKDKHTVTVRVNELFSAYLSKTDNSYDSDVLLERSVLCSNVIKGDKFLLNVAGVETVFTVNRANLTTASTNAFPRKLKLPNVGAAALHNVKNISKLNTIQ